MNNCVKNCVKGMVNMTVGLGTVCIANAAKEIIPEPVKMAAELGGGIVTGLGMQGMVNGMIDLVTKPRKEKKND